MIQAPTMLIWFVRRIFMIFGCLGIVRAQEIEPLGRRVKRFVEKMRFCWHLTKSVTHPTRSAGRLERRRARLLKSRRHPANWRGHLWAVCMDLTPVGGHLSPVDAGSTAVEAGLAKVNTASTIVATAPPNADTPFPKPET